MDGVDAVERLESCLIPCNVLPRLSNFNGWAPWRFAVTFLHDDEISALIVKNRDQEALLLPVQRPACEQLWESGDERSTD